MQRLYLSVLYLVGVLLVEALHLVLAAQRPLDVAQVEGVEGRRGRIADKVAADDVTGRNGGHRRQGARRQERVRTPRV